MVSISASKLEGSFGFSKIPLWIFNRALDSFRVETHMKTICCLKNILGKRKEKKDDTISLLSIKMIFQIFFTIILN